MTAPVVIEHLFKTYTRRRFIGKNVEKTVLHDVSLMLEEDHVLGLVGIGLWEKYALQDSFRDRKANGGHYSCQRKRCG